MFILNIILFLLHMSNYFREIINRNYKYLQNIFTNIQEEQTHNQKTGNTKFYPLDYQKFL